MRLSKYDRLRRKLYEHEIRTEGFKQGLTEALTEKMNTMVDFMRAHGISPEQIDAVKAEALKAAALHS